MHKLKFPPFSKPCGYALQGQGDSWYHIAWGFLKAGGDRGTQHRERRGDGERGGGEGGEGGSGEGERGEQEGEGVKWRYVGKKCRLQLYCYPKGRKSPSSTVKVGFTMYIHIYFMHLYDTVAQLYIHLHLYLSIVCSSL